MADLSMKVCGQKDCGNPGAYRFTWPGRNEDVVCEMHAPKLRSVAEAVGLLLQLIPLDGSDG